MKSLTSLFLIWLLLPFHLKAQSKPYFQQEVYYNIRVKLDDQNHTLEGFLSMEYTNRSSDTLTFLYFHLWPNAYKHRKTAFAKQLLAQGKTKFHFAKPEERGYIDQLDFQIDGVSVKWSYWQGNEDICRLQLPQPLLPGRKIRIETPFFVKIPKTFSRLGHEGNQYQITQWYPKPAVYDSAGWHPMPYLDQGEFYSEFGTYEVFIEVPEEYVVAATGRLTTESEIKWLEERERLSRKALKENIPLDSLIKEKKTGRTKILHFKEKRIHDFAWFCDPSYYVLTDTVHLPYSQRVVKVKAYFTESGKKVWHKATDYLKEAIYYYSLWVGDYPYDEVAAVEGALGAGGGMEYPTITVIAPISSEEGLRQVIIHEVGHNWFYGILGSNEREFPWMDEGINSYYEARTLDTLRQHFSKDSSPQKKRKKIVVNGFPLSIQGTYSSYDFTRSLVYYVQGGNLDQPMNLPADGYSSLNYGAIIYGKVPLAFHYLSHYLGEERFDQAMQAYYKRWQFKHPSPDAIQYVFENEVHESMDWFFQNYFSSSAVPDFYLKVLERKEDSLRILVANRSSSKSLRALPTYVGVFTKDFHLLKTIPVGFSESQNQQIISIPVPPNAYYVAVNPYQLIPENRFYNNAYRIKAKWFPHWSRFTLHYGFSIDNPYEKHLNFILPVTGYNTTNGFMAGVLFYSQFFPKRWLEFHFLPMYGFRNNVWVGSSGFTLRCFPEGLFRKVEWRSRSSYFANLFRIKHQLEFYMKPKEYSRMTLTHFGLNLFQREIIGSLPELEKENATGESPFAIDYIAGRFYHRYKNGIFRWVISGEIGTTGRGTSRLDLSNELGYRFLKSLEVYLRMFGGYFLGDSVPAYLGYYLNGFDPFGEHILINRSQPISSLKISQIVGNHGGFRVPIFDQEDQPTQWVYSNKALFTTNFTLSYGPHFLSLGYDAGIAYNQADKKPNVYQALSVGLHLPFFFSLYFPLYLQTPTFSGMPSLPQHVSFQFHLTPLELPQIF